jgi:hypothetical protein
MSPSPAEIRKFILDTYNEDEFVELFCADYFPQARGEFSAGISFSLQAQRLISYCQNQNLLNNLLVALQKERPDLYAQRFPSAQPAPASPPAPMQARIRNLHQVFISHAHQDAAFAQKLADDLRKQGWDIWIAPDNIKPGEKWVEAIERGMDESGVFLPILSPAAAQSQWVRQEAYSAIALENRGVMRLIPVYIEECDVPTMLSGYQRVTMLDRYEDGLADLGVALSGQEPQPPEVAHVDVAQVSRQEPPSPEMAQVSEPERHSAVTLPDLLLFGRKFPPKVYLLSVILLGFIVLMVILAASNSAMFATAPNTPSESQATPEGEVVTTDSGLQYVEIKVGTGAQAENGKKVVVHYIGYLDNGEVFDSSEQQGEPFEFEVGDGRVIKGIDEGVGTMREGGHRRLIIPPELGYGDHEQFKIPPNSRLTVLVELVSVR